MKITKLLTLALAVIMCVSALVACGGGGGGDDELQFITVTVRVVASGRETPIIDDAIVNIYYNDDDGYVPSALDAVVQACKDFEFEYTLWNNDRSLESISGEALPEVYATNEAMWWRYTINGVEPENGSASENAIKGGDVIIFSYEAAPEVEAGK